MTDARDWLTKRYTDGASVERPAYDALLAVLDLHAPSSTDDVTVDGDEQWCTECVRDWDGEDWDRVAYPCATVRAITKALVVSEWNGQSASLCSYDEVEEFLHAIGKGRA